MRLANVFKVVLELETHLPIFFSSLYNSDEEQEQGPEDGLCNKHVDYT